MVIFVFCFYCLFLLFVFIFLVYFLSYSFMGSYLSKSSPFECGFQMFSMMKEFFSFPFFLLTLMFLLFDVEIILLCFFPLSLGFHLCFSFFMGFILFLIFFSTLYEWSVGILCWV